MCPNINNIIGKINGELHPTNLIKKAKANCTASLGKNANEFFQVFYMPLLLAGSGLTALNLLSEKINDNEGALREVYEIDKEAFAETDPYENFEDFKSIIARENLATYCIKNEDGEIMGYYQLEPVKDADLYIDSMGLKPEYRKTKVGYQAIKFAWLDILKYASENNVKTISLHVNANDKSLLNLYTKFGFVVKETLPNYYENGSNALLMELVVPEELNQKTTEEGQIGLPKEDVAKKAYVNEFEKAVEELKSADVPEFSAREILTECSYVDESGAPVLNKALKDAYLEIRSLLSENDSHLYAHDIFGYVIQKDSKDVKRLNSVLLEEIRHSLRVENSGYELKKNLQESSGKGPIDAAYIRFATDMYKLGFYRTDVLRDCRNDDGTFNIYAADFYRQCLALAIAPSDFQYVSKVMVSTNDGMKTVKPNSVLCDISNNVSQGFRGKHIYTYYSLIDIAAAGCDIEEYLTHHDHVVGRLGRTAGTLEIASMITACMSKKADLNNCQQNQRKFDYSLVNVYNKYKEILVPESFSYEAKEKRYAVLGRLINACKVISPSGAEYFDENIMQKALLLMEKDFALTNNSKDSYESEVIDIINACKKERVNYLGRKEIVFDDAIFNKVIESLDKGEITRKYVHESLMFCKQYNPLERSETFDYEAFTLYNKICEQQSCGWGWRYNKDVVLNDGAGYPKINMNVLRTIAYEVGSNDITLFIDRKINPINGKKEVVFSYDKLRAFNMLRSMDYELNPDYYNDSKYKQDVRMLNLCNLDSSNDGTFSNAKFNKLVEFIKKGYSAQDLLVFENKTHEQVCAMEKLLEQGFDLPTASNIASSCFDGKGNVDEKKLQNSIELYDMGKRGDEVSIWSHCYDVVQKSVGVIEEKTEFNETAYERMKQLISQGLDPSLILTCKTHKVYKDRLYKFLINLKEQNYPNNYLKELMNVCKEGEGFNQRIYDAIFELEKLGIEKENITEVLKACKYGHGSNNKFSEEAYNKVSELFYKEYDYLGIIEVLKRSTGKRAETFSQERYAAILNLTAKHKQLRDVLNTTDNKIVAKMVEIENSLKNVHDIFGEDVLDYAISLRIDGLVSFVNNCENLIKKASPEFINDLKHRLDLLPSPELKVKRLRSLGSLSKKVSYEALSPLVDMINSVKMSDEQRVLVNKIFADESLSSEEQIEMFVSKMNVPARNRDYIINYLRQAQLDKQIQRPNSIEEQISQLENFAQQMLTNPKIPLDKKIKYIDEYKIKQADMLANPDKYTAPRVFPKVMKNLQNVIEAYINIPNADIKFNNSIYVTMYKLMDIETNEALLQRVRFDTKYFDRLLETSDGFRRNFKRLIELIKLNEDKTFAEARITMPDVGSQLYARYSQLGLIEQIEANLDTKRQFKEANLDFDFWNQFDKDLRSESFNVEIDPAQEYFDLKNNITNELQGELIGNISSEKVEELFKLLDANGFTIFNNAVYYAEQKLSNVAVEKLINLILKHAEQNEQWRKVLNGEDIEASALERENMAGFVDHIKGFKKKLEDIQSGRNISDIYVRLSDVNDIGRNIFFGNHVGCCNKVESDYAGYSAPQHLINAYTRGIEIVDAYGNSYGNSLCYFAKIDGEITFVIDSFEANGKLASNPIVTENIVKFAKMVCKQMGCENAPIIFGPNYNHLSLDDYKLTPKKSFKVIGTVSHPTYCDTVGGRNVQDQINNLQSNKNVYQFMPS